MKKDEAIQILIDKIYENDTHALLSKREIKRIETFYKDNFISDDDFEEFIKKDPEVDKLLKKSKSAMSEVKKQYETNRGLQGGILSECFYVATLAKLFNLNKFVDLETCLYNEVPVECNAFIHSNDVTFNCGRYLYYNKDQKDIFIIQYGNPALGDAEIVINKNKIRLEFKENKAKAGEYDIKYNEEGKLILTEQFISDNPELSKMIEEFNDNTDVISHLGHRYNDLDEELKMIYLRRYFKKNDIDVLISTSRDNHFLAITLDCLDSDCAHNFVSTSGSEIRTTGKNPSMIFTPNFFEKVIGENAIRISNNEYRVLKKELTKGRGINVPTRYKINEAFFVFVKDLIDDGDYYIIKRDTVKQIVPTISVHIEIIATFMDLKEYFENRYL